MNARQPCQRGLGRCRPVRGRRVAAAWASAVLPLLVGACAPGGKEASPADADKLSVFVSIAPQKFLVERVGGSHVAVSVLLPPGQSPHTYEPTPGRLGALAEARLYLRIGVPFERQVVDKVEKTFPNLHVVDMAEGCRVPGTVPEVEEEHDRESANDHDHGHDHDHGDTDPHTWMSPRLAKVQAGIACRELCRLDAANTAEYEANLAKLSADLDAADQRIAELLGDLRGRSFYVFHPAYGYFADAYGLKQVAIEAGGRAPTAMALQALIPRARAEDIKLILVQPQFDRSNAELIAREIGGSIAVADPLAEDYIENLVRIAETIRAALVEASPAPND